VPGRLDDIKDRRGKIRSSLDALELDEDNEDNRVRADALLEEWTELSAEMEPLQARADKIAAVRQALIEEDSREGGSDPIAVPVGNSRRSAGIAGMAGSTGPDLMTTQTRYRDPFADLESVRLGITGGEQVRDRAVQVIESFGERSDHWALDSEAVDHALKLVQKGGKAFGTGVARQMLCTGSPEYLASFESYLNDPGGYAQRAALSLTSANGGYLVPFTLDPTIILTNAGSANPYRQIATVKTTTTNDWNGVTSAGVSAEWTAEGTEASDASPTVGQLKITPQKADAYLFGSFEILSDSDFASQLSELLADAKDRIEETAFAVGTGSGQPNGVIPRSTVLAAAAGTAATGPTSASVYALQAALPARWRGPRANNVWLGNLTAINALRNVPAFTGATTSIVQEGPDGPRLLGKPFLESTSIVGAFANGNKVLAYLDARQFYIVDRVGMSVVYDPVVLGANRRPTGQGAWYAFWRTGSDMSTTSASRALSLTT
jgi:HK97 family phage major capsid protein